MTREGRETRWGAVVRADAVDRLTGSGWAALEAHGVRTVLDLRNDDEVTPDRAPRPASLRTVRLPLDGVAHTDFWEHWASGPQFATPLYYGPHLERFPERSARVIAAIAHAQSGGVLVHCVGGNDRTGQIAMLLLALAGVAPEDIAADYALSAERIRHAELVLSTLRALDVEARLRAGGLTDADLAALRDRLLRPPAAAAPPARPAR